MNTWKRYIGGIALILGLAVLPHCGLGETSAVPEGRGIVLTGEAKQDYIQQQMDALYYPPENKKPVPFTAPEDWGYEKISIGNVPVERLAPQKPSSNRVVLQLHGGAYMSGLTDLYRTFAVRQAEYTNAREIYCVEYRHAPLYHYPAALEDAATVYQGLLARGTKPSDIIIYGDSAGGNLAVELAIYLRDEGLPQPAALILLSPWADFAHKDGTSRTENFTKDKVLGKGTPFAPHLRSIPPYAGSLPLDDPRLSVIHADLSGLPPMLIQTGGYDLLLTEDEVLAAKAAADGTPVTLSIYPEMPHVFPLVLPELAESFAAFEEVREFVNQYLQP